MPKLVRICQYNNDVFKTVFGLERQAQDTEKLKKFKIFLEEHIYWHISLNTESSRRHRHQYYYYSMTDQMSYVLPHIHPHTNRIFH